MVDHVKAANALENACILIADCNNHIDPSETDRIERLRRIIVQLELEAENLRLGTIRIIKGNAS